MKFDKETIVKQHFWLLTATAALSALIGWALLLVLVPATASGDRDKIQKSVNTLKKYNQFKNPEYIKDERDKAERIKKALSSIHGELYKSQEATGILMRWPKTMVDRGYDIQHGKFAYDIEVHAPKAVAKSLPKDTETLMSGTLGQSDQDWFEIVSGKGETVKFLRSASPKITDRGAKDGKPSTTFLPLGKLQGRLVTVTFLTGKFFGDELTESEILAYRDTYKDQLPEVIAESGPLNPLDQHVLMYRYAKESPRSGSPAPPPIPNFKERFTVVNDNWVYAKDKLPPPDSRFFPYEDSWREKVKDITSEEIWAAQETIWVQRELFREIKVANDAIAKFELVKGSADAEGKSGSYRNFYWQLDLKVTDDGVTAKLTNLRPQPQSIDNLHFSIRFKDKDGKPSEPVSFPPAQGPGSNALKSLPLGPAGAKNDSFSVAKAIPLPGAVLGPIDSIEQMLTVETAAVKRIDVIAVAAAFNGDIAVGHRQANKPLLPFDKTKKPAPAPPPTPTGDPNDPQDKPPPAPVVDMTTRVSKYHRIVLDRYVEVTPESRKLPVNMVLIVGPEHMSRVEAALISSPLRFLPTQVMWQRAQLTLGGSEGSRPSVSSSENQENVELTIYGLVTLYQRPNRPAFAIPGKK